MPDNNPSLTLPPWELLNQCRDVVQSFGLYDWEALDLRQQRALALSARWAIERAFAAVFHATNRPMPSTLSLCELHSASGIQLLEEHWQALAAMDRNLIGDEDGPNYPDDADEVAQHHATKSGQYLDALYLANAIHGTVQNVLLLRDIAARK